MCDTISGELIICFPKVDLAARRLVEEIRVGNIEHVSYVESLEQKLGHIGMTPYDGLDFEFHLIRVPGGEEQWKITYLQFFYKIRLLEALQEANIPPEFLTGLGRSDYQFTVVHNSWLSLNARPHSLSVIQAAEFAFSQHHGQYKTMISAQSPAKDIGKVKIIVLDSGIADDAPLSLTDEQKCNFVDPKNPKGVTDEHGHGTVVSLIINDIAPGAQLFIYKVANAAGKASEWDTLAAVATCANAHVINMSLQFGLGDRVCETCGRESQSSRSAVFENMISQFSDHGLDPVFVASSGNYQQAELVFPARFANVLAISAINSHYALSSFSNYGGKNHEGKTHENYFVLPGGESESKNVESIGTFGPQGKAWWGTSFATAYASGIVANFIAQQGTPSVQHATILQELKKKADKNNFINYSSSIFGNGMMRL